MTLIGLLRRARGRVSRRLQEGDGVELINQVMTLEEKLLNEACERYENWSSSDSCEDMANCPVHKLYILATEKRKVKVVNRIIDKNTPPHQDQK